MLNTQESTDAVKIKMKQKRKLSYSNYIHIEAVPNPQTSKESNRIRKF